MGSSVSKRCPGIFFISVSNPTQRKDCFSFICSKSCCFVIFLSISSRFFAFLSISQCDISTISRCQALALRSEEHTSELQSRPHLVCRLLLEKKKENKNEGY